MAKTHENDFDVTRPALVLLFGNTSKKHRLLDRDAIVVGRARGCDLGLEAPDVSSVHCVITRGPGGYHLRDCQSRAGTKFNGNAVREATLRDGDLLQIGPFSFRVHLPAGCIVGASVPNASRLQHLERSRRNLARLALRRRKLLRLVRALQQDGNGKAVRDQLSKQLTSLKGRIRDYDQRVRALEDAERELARDRETLDREMATFRTQVQSTEQQQIPTQELQAFESEKKEFSMTRDQWTRDQATVLARLGAQKAALAQAEETLHKQRQELDDFLACLQDAQAGAKREEDGELEILRVENEQLRELLADVERERERADAAAAAQALAAPAIEQEQQGEVALLRKLLAEKEVLLEELRSQPARQPVERDIDTYESELNGIQRQLEADRSKLTREIEQMRARNLELDEATREMELEMSRERAELARERQRLDRLREDVRQELERMQRDSGLRDRLAPVQNLRDEMINRRNPTADPAPAPRAINEDAVQARLRALRDKVHEQ
jgi:pSer/pThr/pTyr-binding forkhead associated (FHA) protein